MFGYTINNKPYLDEKQIKEKVEKEGFRRYTTEIINGKWMLVVVTCKDFHLVGPKHNSSSLLSYLNSFIGF